MTGMEFIRFVAKMKKMRDLGRAQELMKMFELNPSGKLKKMSKGMKQKIGIVCAFMNPLASILILDEPTSGLDPLMQNRFVELILRRRKKEKPYLCLPICLRRLNEPVTVPQSSVTGAWLQWRRLKD